MASKHFIIPILLLILLPTIITANPETSHSEKTPNTPKEPITIEGMVMCQSCKQAAGSWSLAEAKPLPSAKVSISCKDRKNRVKHYQVVKADLGGYFFAPLHGLDINNYKFYLGHPIHACSVRLVSSADMGCNVLTNINGGIEGAELRDEKKKKLVSGAVVYSAGPLAFRPAHCLPPVHY
ncbi:hypothetical protein IHE45_07G117200 [Dioscorea alata]|uniref:Uncharacterized protein n=1 Tax=Dioscorea alata TaxID=55571 RepID=A0ACB7VUA6_DIOAL|nr:hypothetical protein IHE45_07G117200 [Dioscorea alata]